ncbi:MAG: helix-turn-helix domain-containing protein [Acidimicrobiales bacterium]|nr:helix-turn-helix domain-containing protein [Acidimicrobiales bacterium]
MSDTGDGFEAVRETYPAILTTAQVAEMLDLNVRTVLNMAGDGRLPASRLAGSRKFHYSRDQIIETLKANTVDPAEEAKKKAARAAKD